MNENERQFEFNPIKKIISSCIPHNLLIDELGGLYGDTVLAEMGEIIKYYNIYENGAEFMSTTDADYVPSDLHFKKIRTLIDKEARFMFSKSPDINLKPIVSDNDTDIAKVDILQQFINEVLKKNHFKANLVKAAKDCFIGKRIAIVCNFNDKSGITVNFIPSLEFTYEIDENGGLSKLILFYSLNDSTDKNKQRIQKKKYWIENDFCHVSEAVYDGSGNPVETLIDDMTTSFPYIPATVVLNDGLTGDTQGESEIVNLYAYESSYSKYANKDMDAENQNMNPIRYTTDMDNKSTANLTIAPGAYWDLHSDTNAADGLRGNVGVIESNMNYSAPLDTTLNRINNAMFELIDMPSVTADDLKGVVTSGKTLKAIYWSLIVRCDEKFLAWKPELEFIVKCLIDGGFYYPDIAARYVNTPLQDVEYTVDVVNQYPLPEDEADEKTLDMAEVSNKLRSIKSYLKKWEGMTDKEADAEIDQILKEQTMFEQASGIVPDTYNEIILEENE